MAFAPLPLPSRRGFLGLDLIVTDHHLPDAARGVPAAIAVLNPNGRTATIHASILRRGVSFKLAQALLEAMTGNARARN